MCASAIRSSPACTARTEPGGTSSTRATVTKRSDTRPSLTKGLESALTRRYSHRVATILLAGVDLFFRGKLEALLPEHHLITTDGVGEPELVIADVARIEPEEVADAYPDVPIPGFTNH